VKSWASEPEGAEPRRSSRRTIILSLGLVFTFVGLLLSVLLLPSDSSALLHALPLAAAGFLLLWLGGILLGRSARG